MAYFHSRGTSNLTRCVQEQVRKAVIIATDNDNAARHTATPVGDITTNIYQSSRHQIGIGHLDYQQI
jgi:hypothetical protein